MVLQNGTERGKMPEILDVIGLGKLVDVVVYVAGRGLAVLLKMQADSEQK